jgi:DNA ligase-1
MFERNLFGLEKDGSIKVWNIEVVGFERDFGLMKISHGKQGGKLTLKSETFVEGKQGRTPVEQAISEAQSRVTKQIKKGYRDSVEELTNLPILAMLSKDHTKAPKNQEEKIKDGVFTSDKLDGIRLMAFCKLVQGVKTIILKSRTGEVIELPHIAAQLLTVMEVGEILDGEAYLHGPQLQDINSAVQRTDTQAKIDEAVKKVEKARYAKVYDEEKHKKASAELENALLIHDLRPKLEFHVFDTFYEGKLDVPFSLRVIDLINAAQRFNNTTHIKQVAYRVANSIEELTEQLHDCINRGYEGIMYRFANGVYESGKRSSFLWKFKLFFDEEFEIVGSHKDKQGGIIFELKNNLNDEEFDCVMGSYDWRLAVADDDFSGQYMTVKFQARNKGTLIPQFGTGKDIRKGTVINGVFTPSM